jgi:ribosome maturation factor RimP
LNRRPRFRARPFFCPVATESRRCSRCCDGSLQSGIIRQLSSINFSKAADRPLFLLSGDMSGLPERAEQEIETIVSSEGLELVHIEYRKQGHGFLLRIDIDKEGGITVEDCELVSHQVSAFLDVDDVVPAAYELQVSSPGLDRKFYKLSDYEKFIGRLVRVRTSKSIRGLHVIVGRLKEFNGETIVVTDPVMKKDSDYVVPLADIKETRLEVEI